MKPIRACPICPDCNSKRFERMPGPGVIVRCRQCKKVIEL